MTTARSGRADRRREALLAAGLRLFAERGFRATTISDIADATGTAHGLVYHYFRSKEELLTAVLERFSFLADLRRLLAVAPGRPAAQVLGDVAFGFSRMLDERRDLLHLIVSESGSNAAVAEALRQVMDEGRDLLAAYLEARVEVGELRPHDTTVPARILFWTIVTKHLGPADADEFEAGLVAVLLDGVRAR